MFPGARDTLGFIVPKASFFTAGILSPLSSLLSLALQFNVLFLHEKTRPFSGLCFGISLIIAWWIFLMPSAFTVLTLQMLAPGYSLDIFYIHLSILCRGASHPENVTVYHAADETWA